MRPPPGRGPKIGLIWIDGAHDRSSVLDDIDSWLPHLADGARLYIHDAFSAVTTEPQESSSPNTVHTSDAVDDDHAPGAGTFACDACFAVVVGVIPGLCGVFGCELDDDESVGFPVAFENGEGSAACEEAATVSFD